MTITSTENNRRITLRVSASLHQALSAAAAQRKESLNSLAIAALNKYLIHEQERFPLQEMSNLLAPAAEAKGLQEEDVMRHIKETRRRIWQERYAEMIGSSEPPTS